MNKDELYMQRALDLAISGLGYVSPNPMVGCVVVYEDKIIGEGFHKLYGGPHAEVNAINSIHDKDFLKESTVYVSLEPCSHHGKTPPCADLLVDSGVKRVCIGMEDPNPKVSGGGIRRLKEAGIEVQSGLLEQDCRNLNKRFIINQTRKRPYVILKWAQTSDGFIAREDGTSKWISSAESRRLVHKWRAEEDGILVGAKTAQTDNPALNVRDWTGKDPVRIVLDRGNKLSGDLKLFNDGKPTICYTESSERNSAGARWVALGEGYSVHDVLENLYKLDIGSVIIEGGASILGAFIDSGLWDEARIFTAPITFGKGIAAPMLPSAAFIEEYSYHDRLLWYVNYRHG